MSTAEISAVKIENVTDPIKPFIYSCHIRVPGYAQRTGKRLFVQPAFFEHGLSPMFTASQREHQIYFHYPWSEAEDLEIELPAGFALDNADEPAPFGARAISKYGLRIAISKDGRKLTYHRDFFFGGNGSILFPESAYGQLRQFFDLVHKNDEHTLALKQLSAGGN